MIATVNIKILDGPTFSRTLRFVKESREARYDSATQTWSIPANHRILGNGTNRNQYRYAVVLPANNRLDGRCPRYTVDQGCPLHGEFCREG